MSKAVVKSRATGRLKELEAKIDKTAKAVWDMAEALKEIRDDELWKQTHGSWTAYCRDRWDIKTEWAGQTIKALEVRKQLANPDSSRGAPAHVKQAAMLARVPEQDREGVWEDAHSRAAQDGKDEPSLHRHVAPAIKDYKAGKRTPTYNPTSEERAANEAADAASELRQRAEAFVASVENLLERRHLLEEAEAQGCAYTIVSTLHNVAALLEQAGAIRPSVARGLMDGVEDFEDQGVPGVA